MKIASVVPGPEHCITVCFDNHHSMTLDMKEKLHTIRFSGLKNEAVFAAAQTDGKSIHWPGGVSIAISEILEFITK
jgi:hypothetical protein